MVLTAAQVYFTVQNYEVNKQRFVKDVQQSLNTSIENYFAGKAKNSIYILGESSLDTVIDGKNAIAITSRISDVDSILRVVVDSQSINGSGFSHVWSSSSLKPDSLNIDSIFHSRNERSFQQLRFTSRLDTSRARELQFLTQKVMVSISEDLLDLGALYTEFEKELKSKNLNVGFALKQDCQGRKTSIGSVEGDNYLTTQANSVFLGDFNVISTDFENATLIILRNGIGELVLSALLIALVIGTLIHLYKTINTQKQLAAIKDDLISNITHEFKTPIATIFSALEGVTSFNENNDQEKTKRYLELSTDQLHKLNDMVEKMLETATIDQGKLTLNKEEVEVVSWTKEVVKQFQLIEGDKSIVFESKMEEALSNLDRFHFENTLSNLLDNAMKYGGKNISVRLLKSDQQLIWEVEDDGANLPQSEKNKVFDKLYRIPTGNQHDVKGFGIGLYYSKTIVELHGGEISLDISGDRTLFRITI